MLLLTEKVLNQAKITSSVKRSSQTLKSITKQNCVCVCMCVFRALCRVDATHTDSFFGGRRMNASSLLFLLLEGLRFALQPCQSRPDTKRRDFRVCQSLRVLAHSQPEKEDTIFVWIWGHRQHPFSAPGTLPNSATRTFTFKSLAQNWTEMSSRWTDGRTASSLTAVELITYDRNAMNSPSTCSALFTFMFWIISFPQSRGPSLLLSLSFPFSKEYILSCNFCFTSRTTSLCCTRQQLRQRRKTGSSKSLGLFAL